MSRGREKTGGGVLADGATPRPAIPAAAALVVLLSTAARALPPAPDLPPGADEPGSGEPVAGGGGDADSVPGPAGTEAPGDGTSRLYFPPLPFYQETTSTTGLRLFFPLYFETWDDTLGEHSLGVLPFYWRWRGGDESHETDVVLGLYWRLRRPGRFTDIAGPFYTSRWRQGVPQPPGTTPEPGARPHEECVVDEGTDVGLPPLFMIGTAERLRTEAAGCPSGAGLLPPPMVGPGNWSDYQVLALWFWRFASDDLTFLLAPPFYYYDAPGYLRYGLPPLIFGGETGREDELNGDGYAVFFPLFWHFYETEGPASTTVVPPLLVDIDERGDWTAGIVPVLFFGGGEDSAHFTLAPLVHYAADPSEVRVITPLGWYRDTGDGYGGGALLYHQWDEGTRWFRTLAPFWFAWGDEETGARRDLALNVYHASDPVSSDWVVFPFWWDFHDFQENRLFGFFPVFLRDTSLYEDRHTTWVFPTFQYSEWPRTGAEPEGWEFNMHPIVYVGTEGDDHHEVVFPIWWSFSDRDSRTSVGFPLFWDFENRADRSRFWTFAPLVWHDEDRQGSFTLVVNSLYTSTVNPDGTEGWHFHFIPLFDFGRPRPEDVSWSVLYGLVGYDRRGADERLKILWLPFTI